MGTNSNIYVVVCEPDPPSWKTVVGNKCILTTSFYLNLVQWFKACCPGFRDLKSECPKVHLMKDATTPMKKDIQLLRHGVMR